MTRTLVVRQLNFFFVFLPFFSSENAILLCVFFVFCFIIDKYVVRVECGGVCVRLLKPRQWMEGSPLRLITCKWLTSSTYVCK